MDDVAYLLIGYICHTVTQEKTFVALNGIMVSVVSSKPNESYKNIKESTHLEDITCNTEDI